MNAQSFDHVILGGGIYGCYAALLLARRGESVLLLERDRSLFARASWINQARLHAGYHYPRSVATAAVSSEHRLRFLHDHRACVQDSFVQYYALDRYASLTNAAQFERFCKHFDIQAEPASPPTWLRSERLQGLYRTREYSFDPLALRQHYGRLLELSGRITIRCTDHVVRADTKQEKWSLRLASGIAVTTPSVVNATYASTNAIHQLFDLATLDLQYELAEIALISSPVLFDQGLTVMDGPFCSFMPFGKTGLLSLSSVVYTHHERAVGILPRFACQRKRLDCSAQHLANCNTCPERPQSALHRMLAQLRQYVQSDVRIDPYQSLFTIKTKLRANYIDDGRPTEIRQLRSRPDFTYVFGGKINAIYELDRFFATASS